MLTKLQAGSIPYDQKFFCKWNLSFFKAVPPNRLPFNLGSMLHITSSLFFQLDRKSETWFFTFLNVCFLNWKGQNPNLRAFTSKIQVFCRPEWTKGGPHKNEFLQFSNAKMEVPKQIGHEKQMKKMASLVLYSYLLRYGPEIVKNCVLFAIFCWCQQKI